MRSAEMEYVSVIMQEHLAHDCLERLGGVGTMQFTDLNGDLTAFKRFFTPFIKRCDDLEKKLKFFEEEMKQHGVNVEAVTPGEFTVWRASQSDTVNRDHRGMGLLDYWEAIVNERFSDYQQVKTERDKTAASLYQAVQRRFVIEKAHEFFAVEKDVNSAATPAERLRISGSTAGSRADGAAAAEAGRAGGRDDSDDMQFKHIAGIISTEDKVRFARIVFRASYGQAMVRFADIPCDLLDEKGEAHSKSVFAVFYRGRSLTTKLDRICTAFAAHLHDIPNFARESEVAAALEETKAVIADSMAWLQQEKATSGAALAHLGLLIKRWRTGVQREKAVYHAMNMGVRNTDRGSIEMQGWVLKTAVADVQDAIRQVHVTAAGGGRVQPFYFEVVNQKTSAVTLPSPPTHFHTNKFTKSFQGFVNTYGVPRYREANPALWAIVTFPFLFGGYQGGDGDRDDVQARAGGACARSAYLVTVAFLLTPLLNMSCAGVMFGDIGHATILTIAAAWVVWNEEQLGARKLGEMSIMVYKGRYMLLLMGLFSIYCGAIYNDVFSLGAKPYPTAWRYEGTSREATWSGKEEDVYPFGIDPEWHLSENDLLFFNSLKMKLSVVLGITQMSFGLILKTSNAIHFRNNIDLFCECIPQLVFMIGGCGR